jgi:hypothetical protein
MFAPGIVPVEASIVAVQGTGKLTELIAAGGD